MSDARRWTCHLLEQVADGRRDPEQVMIALTRWLSEADVYNCMHANEFLPVCEGCDQQVDEDGECAECAEEDNDE